MNQVHVVSWEGNQPAVFQDSGGFSWFFNLASADQEFENVKGTAPIGTHIWRFVCEVSETASSEETTAEIEGRIPDLEEGAPPFYVVEN